MNSLMILDSGSRVPLINNFIKESKKYDKQVKVIAADCDLTAAALYVANEKVILPKTNEKTYIKELVNECKKRNVKMIIPLFEDDLLQVSKNKNILEKEGIKCLVSDYKTIALCQDKKKMNEYLKQQDYPNIETVQSINDFKKYINRFPVILKRKNGAGSIGKHIVETEEELIKYFNLYEDYIIQPVIKGKEIGVDVYVDMISHKVTSIFAKEKILMKNGETNKSISIKDYKLFKFIKEFVEKLNFVGPIDIDLFEYNNEYFIFDVNPRFGGGYLHAHECNVKFTNMILNNFLGIENKENIGEYDSGIMMMKYSDVKIIDTKK
ncbi:ATP-grasp domain-containing protein [uncultured Clostridium sp.]|uniref:ATP-grasp domain-containing protein n=1 Tax=uncultured Clostridium sp. TaxID=59620 RepID=UPI0025EA0C16|nr:ATP-grasp domain-containing protein [uncultured Clostridium sp.]